MSVWKVGLVLLPLCVGCRQLPLPTTPAPVTATVAEASAPRAVVDTRQAGPALPAPAPAPVPPILEPPRITVPAWQQAIVTRLVAGLTETAIEATKKNPGTVVTFELDGGPTGGSTVVGELRDPRQRQSGFNLYLHYFVIPGALSFPDKATLLRALQTAVTYKAEVRLRSGDIACCLEKRAIAVTGRFEAAFSAHPH